MGLFLCVKTPKDPCKRTQQVMTVARQQCCVRLYGPKSLTGFKLHASIGANRRNMMGPTMLLVVGQQHCLLIVSRVVTYVVTKIHALMHIGWLRGNAALHTLSVQILFLKLVYMSK